MTLEIDGIDIIALAQAGIFVGGFILALLAAWLVYLMVRPPRHVRQARNRPAELGEDEAEQMLRAMDRMEARIETLERLLVDLSDREAANHRQTAEGRENGRTG